MKSAIVIFFRVFIVLCLAIAGLTVDADSAPVSQQNWGLIYVDSQEVVGEDGRGENAFDGDPATIWHTEWKNSKPAHPHEIQIDLGETYELESFHYLPRQGDNVNGRIKDYQLYVSDSFSNWGVPVVSGSFPNTANEQIVLFSSLPIGRYLRLVALSEVNGRPFTSIAEINVTGALVSGVLPPTGVIDTPVGDVTVVAGEAVFFSGRGSDANDLSLTYHWDFGDSSIADATVEDPGEVRFNNSGTYTVTFTVTNSEGLLDSDTRRVAVLNPNQPDWISKSSWGLIYVDSQEVVGEDGRGVNAFDGDPATIWHTEWKNSKPAHPHEIQIDLGETYELESFHYLPRQGDNVNGRIKDYQLYVSDSFSNWGVPVVSGSFPNTANEQIVLFSSLPIGRYLRLVALSEVNGRPFTSIAEINVTGALVSGVLPPTGVIDTPVGDVTVVAGEAVFFSGRGSDANDLSLTYHWDFGDSSIADATVEDPGEVRFNNSGTYTVTFTVTNSEGLLDSDTRRVAVLNPNQPDWISKSSWGLIYVDSQEVVGEDGRGVNAFDGDPATIWHTEWKNSKPAHPHEIQIDLGETYELESFHYLPRQGDNVNGRIKDYQLYVSDSFSNWGVPVVSGSFPNTANEQIVLFSSLPIGRYLRLVALSEVNGQPFTALSEINFMGRIFDGNLPPRGTIDNPTQNVTIITGDSVYFSGTGLDPDNNFPLTYQWNFGDPMVADVAEDSPGFVQFNHPGTYTVTFTVADAFGRPDPIPPTRIVKVADYVGDNLIPQTEWRLKYVNSEELAGEDGRGINSFDGNPGTLWHTQWLNGTPTHPHEIQIDLGSAYALNTLHYLPRQDGNSNGRISNYAISVSGNGVDWEFPVAMGSFANTSTQKTVLFAPKMGRFIRLAALSEVTGRPYASAAEINVEGVCQTPYVKLVRPLTMHVQSSSDLRIIAAVCLNRDFYPGWGIKYVLGGSNGIIEEVQVTEPPYEYTFQGLSQVEHTVEAFIVDDNGGAVIGADSDDWSVQVGIGDYYVAIGDSITVGEGDDISEDNQSQDGRNIKTGFTPILNDHLTTSRGYPHTVSSEGVGGIQSAGGLLRLSDAIKRHPDAAYYLIQYGTNDSLGPLPVPSGQGLNPGDAGYPGSFKDNMQRIIDTVLSAGKAPYVAKVPFTLSGTTRNNLIRQYNVVIDELVLKNGIEVVPPDFFSYFEANPSELTDTVHPNGQGYQAMANLWHNALTQ